MPCAFYYGKNVNKLMVLNIYELSATFLSFIFSFGSVTLENLSFLYLTSLFWGWNDVNIRSAQCSTHYTVQTGVGAGGQMILLFKAWAQVSLSGEMRVLNDNPVRNFPIPFSLSPQTFQRLLSQNTVRILITRITNWSKQMKILAWRGVHGSPVIKTVLSLQFLMEELKLSLVG